MPNDIWTNLIDSVTALEVAALTYERLANKDTDPTLAANSDVKYASQKAIKTYVDNFVTGLSWKQSVRAATTAPGTLATAFENGKIVDGITLATGDRILIKNQVSGADNGIYLVAAAGAPLRALDANTAVELLSAAVFVREGTTNADTQWTCTNDAITLGTSPINFAQVSGAGTYTAGAGLTLTGNQFSIGPGQVTNAMLAGSIAAAKLIGTDITTVGTITTGTWSATPIAIASGGTGATTAAAALANLGAEELVNKDTDITLAANSDVKYPSQKAIKAYIAAQIAAAGGSYTAGAGLTLTGNQFSIGPGQVTNTMLAGSIAAAKLIGTDITTVGTITTGTWNATPIAIAKGGTGITAQSIARVGNASGTQNVAGNTVVAVTFITEDFDTNNIHSTSANVTRMSAPYTGKYLVTGGLYWSAQAPGTATLFFVRLSKNNAPIEGARSFYPPISTFNTNGLGMPICAIVALTAGDYVEMEAFHDGSGTLTLDLAKCSLQVAYIGA